MIKLFCVKCKAEQPNVETYRLPSGDIGLKFCSQEMQNDLDLEHAQRELFLATRKWVLEEAAEAVEGLGWTPDKHDCAKAIRTLKVLK